MSPVNGGHQTDHSDLCLSPQERMECAKRSWEVQQLQKLKAEEADQLFTDGEEDLFTYTREDAYNMVGSRLGPSEHL